MSSPISIRSTTEFNKILSSNSLVVVDFNADWCGPCKTIAPTYEALSKKHSSPKRIAFTQVDVDAQQEIAQRFGIRAMPTFLIIRSGSVIDTIQGADPRKLTSAVENAVKLVGAAKPVYSSAGRTLGGAPPRGGQSLSRPLNIKGFVDAVIAFFGLYFYSLFSFDAYTAAEKSPFNVNRVASPPQTNGPVGSTGAATRTGKKLGTIADITGGN